MLLGRANPSNYIPKNSSVPWSGGTSKPRGNGAGSWVSGSKTPRGNHTPGKKRGTGRGSRPKKPVNTTPKTTPQGTNTNINTRGNTATSRALGGAAIVTATPVISKALLIAGVTATWASYLFLKILGVFDTSGSDGTLPEHLRQPGEQEKLGEGEPPPWYGGQNPNITYRVKYGVAEYSPTSGWYFNEFFAGFEAGFVYPVTGARILYQNLETGEYEDAGTLEYIHGSRVFHAGQGRDANGNWNTFYFGKAFGLKVVGFEPADGSTEADPYAGVPGGTPATKTESTTNNSAPPPKRATLDNPPPPGIRPPLPSNRTANPRASSRYNRPRPKPTPQPKPPVVKKAVTKAPPSVLGQDRVNRLEASFRIPIMLLITRISG